MHKQQYQKPVLSFDIIEPFRTAVDEYVLYAISTRLAKPEFFTEKRTGMILSTAGKRILIPPFLKMIQNRVKIDGYTTSWYKHIYRTVYQLRQRIEKSKVYDEVSDYLRHKA